MLLDKELRRRHILLQLLCGCPLQYVSIENCSFLNSQQNNTFWSWQTGYWFKQFRSNSQQRKYNTGSISQGRNENISLSIYVMSDSKKDIIRGYCNDCWCTNSLSTQGYENMKISIHVVYIYIISIITFLFNNIYQAWHFAKDTRNVSQINFYLN